jgi:hypothetical protein
VLFHVPPHRKPGLGGCRHVSAAQLLDNSIAVPVSPCPGPPSVARLPPDPADPLLAIDVERNGSEGGGCDQGLEMEHAVHGLALSQSGALVLTAWGTLLSATATILIALFAVFPARTALRDMRAARDQRGWREARYEQAFQDALRGAWLAAHSGHSPQTPVPPETAKVMEAFTQMPNVLGTGDTVDRWLGNVWPEMRKRILGG